MFLVYILFGNSVSVLAHSIQDLKSSIKSIDSSILRPVCFDHDIAISLGSLII